MNERLRKVFEQSLLIVSFIINRGIFSALQCCQDARALISILCNQSALFVGTLYKMELL